MATTLCGIPDAQHIPIDPVNDPRYRRPCHKCEQIADVRGLDPWHHELVGAVDATPRYHVLAPEVLPAARAPFVACQSICTDEHDGPHLATIVGPYGRPMCWCCAAGWLECCADGDVAEGNVEPARVTLLAATVGEITPGWHKTGAHPECAA